MSHLQHIDHMDKSAHRKWCHTKDSNTTMSGCRVDRSNTDQCWGQSTRNMLNYRAHKCCLYFGHNIHSDRWLNIFLRNSSKELLIHFDTFGNLLSWDCTTDKQHCKVGSYDHSILKTSRFSKYLHTKYYRFTCSKVFLWCYLWCTSYNSANCPQNIKCTLLDKASSIW